MKNYFIPHKDNKYEPHILKPKNIFLVLLFVFIILFASYLGTVVLRKTGLLASIQSAFLVDLANKDRADQNITTLVVNPLLVEAAQRKANDMASKGYFAHVSPEGITPWYWFNDVGYSYVFAGENLAVNFTESLDVHKAWITSPTHQKNILDKRFDEVGIATAEGLYKGKKATFVVQMFGKQRIPILPNVFKQNQTQATSTVPFVISETLNQEPLVFGAQDSKFSFSQQTNFLQKIVVSPVSLGRIILILVICILVITLIFRSVIEFKRRHIGGMIAVLIVIFSLISLLVYEKKFFVNTEIPLENLETTTGS